MKYFISYILEPVSYFVYATVFLFLSVRMKKPRYVVLAIHFAAATTLMIMALPINGYNIDLYTILFLLSAMSFSYFFYSLYSRRWKKMVALAIGAAEVVYFILEDVILGMPSSFDSTAFVMLSLGIVAMIFFYTHDLLADLNEESLLLNIDFWFAAAQLIYQVGAFGIILTFDYFTRRIMPPDLFSQENRSVLTRLWGVHNVLLFLGSLLTASGLLWVFSHKRSQSSSSGRLSSS